eukprot:CAMPEP_0178416812 /NCGR_PEP_ID=MMETSP0689_2-20121128/24255_1 /TAXON_ID=160604 /ORGANISM="Amphidinium massartii, Strain CS-259" /LENGTH=199 /DNA_ID=CAMNT_0020038165 /DNA_START=29 /DNA_END=628 /DNA_ORIENTATION=+
MGGKATEPQFYAALPPCNGCSSAFLEKQCDAMDVAGEMPQGASAAASEGAPSDVLVRSTSYGSQSAPSLTATADDQSGDAVDLQPAAAEYFYIGPQEFWMGDSDGDPMDGSEDDCTYSDYDFSPRMKSEDRSQVHRVARPPLVQAPANVQPVKDLLIQAANLGPIMMFPVAPKRGKRPLRLLGLVGPWPTSELADESDS